MSKNSLLLSLSFSSFLLLAAFAPSTKHRPVALKIGKKRVRYFRVVRKASFRLSTGTQYKFILRCEKVSRRNIKIVWIGNQKHTLTLNCVPYKRAIYKGKPVGKSNILRLGPFSRSLTLKMVNKSNASFLIRAISKGQKKMMMSLAPQRYLKPVEVVSREKMKTYYLSKRGKVVLLRVIGPTTLRIVSRLIYTKKMRGKQHYRVAVKVGRKSDSFSFSTRKSDVSWINQKNYWLPSVGSKASVAIPKGEQKVLVHCLETVAEYCIFRFYIPIKSVLN